MILFQILVSMLGCWCPVVDHDRLSDFALRQFLLDMPHMLLLLVTFLFSISQRDRFRLGPKQPMLNHPFSLLQSLSVTFHPFLHFSYLT